MFILEGAIDDQLQYKIMLPMQYNVIYPLYMPKISWSNLNLMLFISIRGYVACGEASMQNARYEKDMLFAGNYPEFRITNKRVRETEYFWSARGFIWPSFANYYCLFGPKLYKDAFIFTQTNCFIWFNFFIVTLYIEYFSTIILLYISLISIN